MRWSLLLSSGDISQPCTLPSQLGVRNGLRFRHVVHGGLPFSWNAWIPEPHLDSEVGVLTDLQHVGMVMWGSELKIGFWSAVYKFLMSFRDFRPIVLLFQRAGP